VTTPFRSLHIRNFRLYSSGQVVSLTGTWMGRVAQDWLVYHVLTHNSGLALGFVTALQFVPTIFLGMYGGLLADRYSKRSILIATQATMGLISALIGGLVVAHAVGLVGICALSFAFGIASAIDIPVRQAFVVEMVGRDDLQNAVSLNSAVFNAARIVGPAAAGLLIDAVGTGPAFLLNALSYLAVIGSLIAIRRSELNLATPIVRSRGQWREGLSYVRTRPELMLPIVLIGIVGAFGFNSQITNALMAQGVFHHGAGSYGLLSTAQAAGALGGALYGAQRRRRPRIRLLLASTVVFGILGVASAMVGSYLVFMVLLIPIGFSGILLAVSCNATVQLSVEPQMQGRVMAIYTTIFVGGTPFGSLLVGWIGSAAGPRWALVFGGAICAVAAIVIGIVYWRTQSLTRVRGHAEFRNGDPAVHELEELALEEARAI
jgi:MFS family permease